MKKTVLRILLGVYLFPFLLVCSSLSVPPADLPIYVLMLCIALFGLTISFRDSRRWRVIWITALIFSISGGVLDVVAGKRITRQLIDNRTTSISTNLTR
jgi:hypothetical protein